MGYVGSQVRSKQRLTSPDEAIETYRLQGPVTLAEARWLRNQTEGQRGRWFCTIFGHHAAKIARVAYNVLTRRLEEEDEARRRQTSQASTEDPGDGVSEGDGAADRDPALDEREAPGSGCTGQPGAGAIGPVAPVHTGATEDHPVGVDRRVDDGELQSLDDDRVPVGSPGAGTTVGVVD